MKIERLQIERCCHVIFWIIPVSVTVLHWDFHLIHIEFPAQLNVSKTQRIHFFIKNRIFYQLLAMWTAEDAASPLLIHTFYCEIFAQAFCSVSSLLTSQHESILQTVCCVCIESWFARNVPRETFRIESIAGYVLLVSGERWAVLEKQKYADHDN